jgi:hypothetical protein
MEKDLLMEFIIGDLLLIKAMPNDSAAPEAVSSVAMFSIENLRMFLGV